MFYDTFLQLCNEKGVAPSRVALDLGYSKTTATKWKAGSMPSADKLQNIADYFNVSADYLLGNEKTSPADLTEDDETIIIRQSLKDRPYRKVVFYVDPRVSEEDIADAIEKVEALALVKELKESGKLPDALK